MKLISALILLILITSETYANDSESNEKSDVSTTYTTKYDNVNLDEILHSDRLLLSYVNCLMEKSHCTPDGLELKQNLPDAIDNNCGKCSERQKIGSSEVMHYLIDNKPEWWEDLEKKYNPDGSYKKEYLKEKGEAETQENSKEKE